MNDKTAMNVLGKAAYGCYLLTVDDGENINGMPLSLFVQAGFDPPLVLCGVSPKRRTHDMVERAKKFAVVFLKKEQKNLVDKFKIKGEDPSMKFEGVAWKKAGNGAPVLEDCLGYLECDLIDSYKPGDHTMFTGKVTAAVEVDSGELLTIADLNKHYAG